MKILFATYGSLGDVHPYLALASEARQRGHEPLVATASKYRATVEALGLSFFAVRPSLEGEDYPALMSRIMNSQNPLKLYCQEVLDGSAREAYTDFLLAGEEANLIVAHNAAITAPLAAKTLKKKWVSSSVAPSALFSAYDMEVSRRIRKFDRLGLLTPLWKQILFKRHQSKTRSWFSQLSELRHELETGTKGHPLFGLKYSPHGNLALFSSHYAPRQPSWPKNTCIAGFCFFDAAQGNTRPIQPEVGTDWRAWMKAGKAPFVFAPGSSSVWAAHEFWQASAEKIRHSDERGVFLTAGQNLFAHSGLKEKILELDYVPYSEVFPLAGLVVHAGGIGTMALALRAGKAQLIVPQAFDQFDNAARAQDQGFAVRTNLAGYQSGAAFQQVFEQFETLEKRAKDLGAKISVENGPLAACEFLETLL